MAGAIEPVPTKQTSELSIIQVSRPDHLIHFHYLTYQKIKKNSNHIELSSRSLIWCMEPKKLNTARSTYSMMTPHGSVQRRRNCVVASIQLKQYGRQHVFGVFAKTDRLITDLRWDFGRIAIDSNQPIGL